MDYFLGTMWGIIVGFTIAIPIGPIGLICIQRTLVNNKISGLISGLGAATADALLASVSAFSISFIFLFIKHNQSFLHVLGGGLLIIIGIIALKTKKDVICNRTYTTLGHIEEYLSALVVTITNPISAFAIFVAFAGVSSKIGHSIPIAITFVIGIFIGSCLWWILLTYITNLISHKIKPDHIKTINKAFAVIIASIGFLMLVYVLLKQF